MRILILLLVTQFCNAQKVKTLRGVTINCKMDTTWIHSGDMTLGPVVYLPMGCTMDVGKKTSLVKGADSLTTTFIPNIRFNPGVSQGAIDYFECVPTKPIIIIDGRTNYNPPPPLILVNGWPSMRDVESLDTSKVTRITVLTDSAAIAQYGIAGSNGVILIETAQTYFRKPRCVHSSSPPAKRVFVGHHTKVQAAGKALFRIITTDDFVSKRLLHDHWHGLTRYIIKRNKRKRIFYFKKERWNDIYLFIENGLK